MAVSDLEQAAGAALAGVRALRERLAEAHEGCDESARQIEALGESLEADRSAVRQAVEDLGEASAESAKQIADGAAAADAGLHDVAAAAQEAGAEGRPALDHEAAAFVDLAHEAERLAPQVESLAETVAAASLAALERAAAIADELSDVVADAQHLLAEELAPALAELTDDLEKAAAAVRNALDHECPAILAGMEKEFERHGDEIRELIDRQFPHMQEHAQAVADHSLETVSRRMEEEGEEIRLEARAVETDLEEMARTAAARGAEIERLGQAVVDGLREGGEKAGAVEQGLAGVRLRWSTFGFTV